MKLLVQSQQHRRKTWNNIHTSRTLTAAHNWLHRNSSDNFIWKEKGSYQIINTSNNEVLHTLSAKVLHEAINSVNFGLPLPL